MINIDENLTNTNNAIVCGTVASEPIVSHKVQGEQFYEFTLAIKRLSNTIDLIPICISERLLINGIPKIDDRFAAKGQFRSVNKFIDGKSKLLLFVFCIELLPTLEFDKNEVELIGFICKPPIFRTTSGKDGIDGRSICDVLLAVNRAYNKTDYIPLLLWGRNSLWASEFAVGTKINVNGRIQSRSYNKSQDNGEIIIKTAIEMSVNSLSEVKEKNYE